MAPSSRKTPYPVVGNETCVLIEGEGHEDSTIWKSPDADSACTTSLKVNGSTKHGFVQAQEIEFDEAQNQKLSRAVEYRILTIIWVSQVMRWWMKARTDLSIQICYFWDRQLEDVFVQQNLPVDRTLATYWTYERQDMKSAVLAFYIGRVIGVWLASMAIMMEEFARVIPTSLFLTGKSLQQCTSVKTHKKHPGLFATLLNFYSGGKSSARTVCYFLCAVSSSPLMPAAILLTHMCFGKFTQPIRSIFWATAGPIATFVGEMNLHMGGNKANMPISVAGIMFATLSLTIEPWMARIKSSPTPWFLSQREIVAFDIEEHPSNWSRFRELWKLYKSEV